jgi:hypothetical protein
LFDLNKNKGENFGQKYSQETTAYAAGKYVVGLGDSVFFYS